MDNLQPKGRSFERYICIGIELSGKKLTKKQIKALNDISCVDDAVLIVDDILDKSKQRNGKPCLYMRVGIRNAKRIADSLKTRALRDIIRLAEELGTSKKKSN